MVTFAFSSCGIEELNRQEEAQRLAVNVKFYESERMVKDEQRIYAGGYLFLQKIFYKLRQELRGT